MKFLARLAVVILLCVGDSLNHWLGATLMLITVIYLVQQESKREDH